MQFTFSYPFTGSLTDPACSFVFAPESRNNFVLRSKIGNGHGTPVEAQTVMIARYQPMMHETIPNPPAMRKSLSAYAMPSGVGLWPSWKFAAAKKPKRKSRATKVITNGTFVRREPMVKTNETRSMTTL